MDHSTAITRKFFGTSGENTFKSHIEKNIINFNKYLVQYCELYLLTISKYLFNKKNDY